MNRKSWWLSCIAAVAVPSVIYAGTLTLPHLFTSGTPIMASEMNANFEAVKQAIARTFSSGTRLRALILKSSDGVSLPASSTFWDSTMSTLCSPSSAGPGTYRCLPYSTGSQSTQHFADAACAQQVVIADGTNSLLGLPANSYAMVRMSQSDGGFSNEVRATAAPTQAAGYYSMGGCGPSNCGGCCNGSVCTYTNNTASTCGTSGAICQNCGTNACTNYTCVGGGTPVSNSCAYTASPNVALQSVGAPEPVTSFATLTVEVL